MPTGARDKLQAISVMTSYGLTRVHHRRDRIAINDCEHMHVIRLSELEIQTALIGRAIQIHLDSTPISILYNIS